MVNARRYISAGDERHPRALPVFSATRSEVRGQIAEVRTFQGGFHLCNLTSNLCNPGLLDSGLLAGAATGRFEAIHLRFALRTESAVGGFSVLLLAGTVVESGVWIDPDREARVSVKMDDGRGNLGDSERHECPFPRAERSRSRRGGRRAPATARPAQPRRRTLRDKGRRGESAASHARPQSAESRMWGRHRRC